MESAPNHFKQSEVWIICFIYTKGVYSFGGEQRGRPAVEEGGQPRGLHRRQSEWLGNSPLEQGNLASVRSQGEGVPVQGGALGVDHLGLAEGTSYLVSSADQIIHRCPASHILLSRRSGALVRAYHHSVEAQLLPLSP